MQRKNKKILLKYSLFFILFFNTLRVNSQLIINTSYPINSESGDILCIDIDSNGNIYVGGDNGISFFDGKTFKNTRIEKEFVWALNVINDDSMLYITLKNIILFSDNKKLILKSANNQKMPLIKKLDNEIYVLCDDSLFLYNHGKLFFKYTSNKNIIRDFCKINNQLFIIEEFRIYNYTKKVYQNDIGVFGAHSTAYNKHFIQQMDSIIEINESNGALKIIKRYTNFKQFYYDLFKLNISINDSLFFNKSTKYLFRFKEHNDKIYHLFFKNIVKQSILDIKLINNKINTNFILLDSNLVLNVITKEIYKTEKGKSVFWKKVDNKFINEIDEYSKLYKIRKKYLLINYLKPSYVLNNDFKIINVINGSEIGLYSINNINDTLFSALNNEGIFFFNEHYTYKYINSNEVFLSISKGLNNELFLLKQNGLYNFNLSDFKERLLLITNSFNKVVNINYSYICLNNNNQINIYKYGSKNYNLKLIKELVLKERIINVLEAKNNMIIICDHAIYYYHIENNRLVLLLTQNSELSFLINSKNSYTYKQTDNSFQILTENGFYSISLNKESLNKPLKPELSQILLFNKEINWSSNFHVNNWGVPKNLKLKYNENNLNFKFINSDYDENKCDTLYYRLKGSNYVWISNGLNYDINLNNLTHGNYSLEVFTKNEYNVSSQVVYYSFQILPPWWHTWWFRFVVLFLIGLIVYAFIKYRFNKIKNQKLLIESQMSALRLKMNPHFLSHVLYSVQNRILDKQALEAYEIIAKYNQLVGSTLINSDKEYISLEEEINYLKNYIDLEKERLNPNFNYEILILNINNIPIDLIEIPNMIIQPFVENALLHGLNHSDVINPKLLINFTISKDTIICEIEDNGIGIIENSKSTILSYGIATNTIYERIKLLKQIFKTNIKVDVKNKGNDVKNISGVITKVELPLKFNDI